MIRKGAFALRILGWRCFPAATRQPVKACGNAVGTGAPPHPSALKGRQAGGENVAVTAWITCRPFSSGWSRDLNARMKLDRGNFYLVGTASFIGGDQWNNGGARTQGGASLAGGLVPPAPLGRWSPVLKHDWTKR